MVLLSLTACLGTLSMTGANMVQNLVIVYLILTVPFPFVIVNNHAGMKQHALTLFYNFFQEHLYYVNE